MWCTRDSPAPQAQFRQAEVGVWDAGVFSPTIFGTRKPWPTMIYAEVSDLLLRQDYYQGIAILYPSSDKLSMSESGLTQQRILRQLIEELKTPGLEQSRNDEKLDIILANIS